MKAVIYARYSSEKQDEYSIEGQLYDCYEYAKKNNMTVIREYIDRAITGRTDKRPDFQKMILDSANHEFEAILVWKTDRYFRNVELDRKYKRILKMNGVKIISINEPISEDDASGFLTANIFSVFAEYYSLDLAQKMKRGQKIKAKECLYLGGVIPFGYKVENQKFVIDEGIAPFIREAFRMFADGASIKSISEYFNKNGLKNSYGREFSKNSFSYIFSNKKYIGVYKHDDVEIEGGMPAMIDEELFNRVQERVKKNKKSPGSHKAKVEYLLSGKIYCGYCKENMLAVAGTSSTKKKVFNYYVCKNKKNHNGCNKKNVNKDYIEEFVCQCAVDLMLSNDGLLKHLSKEIHNYYREFVKKESTLPALEKKLRDIEKSINNIMCAIEQGIFTSTTKGRLLALEDDKQNIELEISKERLKHRDITQEDIDRFFKDLKIMVKENSKDLNLRKSIIDMFVDAVFLYDDYIDILYSGYRQNGEVIKERYNIENGKKFVFDTESSTMQEKYELIYIFNDLKFKVRYKLR